MSFGNLKKASLEKFKTLSQKIEAENSKTSFVDDRFWTPTVDASSNRVRCYTIS